MQESDEILARWLSGDLSEQEITVLLDQIAQPNNPWPDYINILLQDSDIIGRGNNDQKERIFKRLEDLCFRKTKSIFRIYSFKWIAAAAVVVLMISLGFWRYYNQSSKSASSAISDSDLLPGCNKAILTLDNGVKIILDSLKNGKLTSESGTAVYKSDGNSITYRQSNTVVSVQKADTISYNTLTTPKGGEYKLILPDGTKVWLNAASQIRYPIAFSKKERNVSILGEAYFEVAKDASRPFHVKMNKSEVTVLGTHFNINAYEDEKTINTTLLEGLVRIDNGKNHQLILPGQEARLDKSGSIKLFTNVDTSQSVAWKNGLFEFNSTDIETVMRQIARWYDVTIEYKGEIPNMRFSGEIPRNTKPSEILKILESSDVHFSVVGKKIIVQ